MTIAGEGGSRPRRPVLAAALLAGVSPRWRMAKDSSLTLSLQNLFDADPPLVVNQAGLAGSALRFDPTYGSPLGRMVQVQLGKKFW
jgi:outer membrane receptor protein involved in Fe transport